MSISYRPISSPPSGKGSQVIGDLKAADDTQRDTLIDFGEDYIGLETSGSVRMVISGSDGKVGIGSTSPSHKLDVNGDIRIRGNDIRDNSGNPAITFDGSTNTSFAGSVTSATLGFTGSLNGTASVALKDQIGETIVGGVYEIDQGLFHRGERGGPHVPCGGYGRTEGETGCCQK